LWRCFLYPENLAGDFADKESDNGNNGANGKHFKKVIAKYAATIKNQIKEKYYQYCH
jgi:membrane protein involved in colicin uptake